MVKRKLKQLKKEKIYCQESLHIQKKAAVMSILECCIAKHWVPSESVWIEVLWNEAAPSVPSGWECLKYKCAQCQMLLSEGGK